MSGYMFDCPGAREETREVVDLVPLPTGYKVIFSNKTHVILPRATRILDQHNRPELIQWKLRLVTQELEEVGVDAFRLLHKDQSAQPIDFLNLSRRLKSEKGRATARLHEAADYGTRVHQWVEDYMVSLLDKTDPPEVPDTDIKHSCEQFIEEFIKKHDIEPLQIEVPVYSLTFGYAGTPDMIALIDGVPHMPDWKTSNGIYLGHVMQNAGYRAAIKEMGLFDFDVHSGPIVKIPKSADDKFAIHTIDEDEYRRSLVAFRSLVYMYHMDKLWRKEHPYEKKKSSSKKEAKPDQTDAEREIDILFSGASEAGEGNGEE